MAHEPLGSSGRLRGAAPLRERHWAGLRGSAVEDGGHVSAHLFRNGEWSAEDGGTVEFYLHQRYAAGSALLPSGFVVKSTCVVRTASDGRIASIEERWNGAPLLDYSAFRWVRRANGLLSAILTPFFT